VVDWVSTVKADVHVMGRGYQPFGLKQDGLLPYQYSVVIENVREPDCFTEKLLDCILCGTLPIYYTPKNIGNYFNLKGMICCQSLDENRTIALSYSNLQQRIVDTIRENDQLK